MKIRDVIGYLEEVAPSGYQEDYDNSGLLVGEAEREVSGVITCLDSTEEVVREAEQKNCNLIVAHHPIVFRGLKRLTGKTYVERVVMQALRKNIAIYAIHTNLDNVYRRGVNAAFADRLDLQHTRILSAKNVMKKLRIALPAEKIETARTTLKEAGVEKMHLLSTEPADETTYLLEAICTTAQRSHIARKLKEALSPPPAVHTSPLEDPSTEIGSGMIGELTRPMEEKDFLQFLKDRMKTPCIRHTRLLGGKISRVAICGGAGGFLLPKALAGGADAFVTADYKYHEFFDADQRILIADIGHYESEQFTIELLSDIISQKFSTFAVYSTEVNTNPVRYFS